MCSNSAYEEFAWPSTGDGRSGLNLGLIRTFRFPLPPLPEQQAIAAVLDSIDDAIERTEAVITATERVRDALLHELLTRGVPGWHTEWKSVPGVGTIPAAWEVVRLEDVAQTITSGSRAWSQYFRPNGAFFVRSQNISGGKLMNDNRKFHIQITLKEAKPPHKRREWDCDLSAEELEKRYIAPYRQGRAIVIDGRVIALDEIHRTRVYWTDRDIRNFAAIPWGMMKDATDELMTGPPGWELETQGGPNQQPRPARDAREVFVVHGRNDTAREAMFDSLVKTRFEEAPAI